MTIPFARSLRSLENETSRPSVIALVLSGVLVAAWMAWSVLAQIDVYEASEDWTVARDGSLMVRFPPASMARLRPGQTGELVVQPDPREPAQHLPATVSATPSRTQNHLSADTVKVTLLSSARSMNLGSGTVRIQVEQISPLTVIERASAHVVGDRPIGAGAADEARR